MNKAFQNILSGEGNVCPPVWFMRQAGRYHQHYQALKQKHTFEELCKVPELAAQVALGPVEEFDFDLAILFSDLLFPLEAFGMGLEYKPGPILDRTLDAKNLQAFKPVDEAIEFMHFQKEAMRLTRELLPSTKSLIGFVGGPWTLFTYAIEGAHKGNLLNAKTSWSLFDDFCEKMVPFLIKNIELQFAGGAECVMIFDTAAGELSADLFREKVEPQLLRLSQNASGHLGYYSKGTSIDHLQGLYQKSKFSGYGYDHRFSLPQIFRSKPPGFIQGNFDQALLFLETSEFRRQLHHYLCTIKDLDPTIRKNWVCGLGHGVLPKTPEAHVKEYVETVRKVFGS